MMVAVMWFCLLAVFAAGTLAVSDVGEGKAFLRAVDAGGAPYNQPFPLLYEEIGEKNSDSTVPRCQQLREPGICRANIPRWYYDSKADNCRHFSYGGCRGNDNNFPTEEHCRAACLDKVVCPTDPAKTCRVSESACVNATCPLHPDAVCSVLPCSCLEVFMDSNGLPVECADATIIPNTTPPPDATTPEFGDGDQDSTEPGRALWYMAVVVMIMIVVGLLLLGLSAVLRRLRGPRGRSCSTATLIRSECKASSRGATPVDEHDIT
ncbi:uncharacterized protein LOC135105382 [Scylla paramamosain]|uniref:uncharacterized protein LOC135105382 n=1 Tax=Scylla paramamosain TaxID=85552 RepID=UPI003082726D